MKNILKKFKEIIKIIIFFFLKILTFPLRYLFPAKISVENFEIEVPNLPIELQNFKMVHLTDFHWDFKPIRNNSNFMNLVIDKVNSINPHLIFLTGDYVQLQPEPIEVFSNQYLKRLNCKYGIYAVLGNHDYKVNGASEIIKDSLKSIGITVLTNEKVKPVPNEKFIELVGIADISSHEFHPERAFNLELDSKNETPFRIVLSHNPESARKLAEWNFDLQLSGHTHGGQVCVPIPSFIRQDNQLIFVVSYVGLLGILSNILVKLPLFLQPFIPFQHHLFNIVEDWSWGKGLHKLSLTNSKKSFYLYTNRGLATHPPLRLFCDPEIAIFHLRSSAKEELSICVHKK